MRRSHRTSLAHLKSMMKREKRRIFAIVIGLACLTVVALPVDAQVAGPITPPPRFELKRIPPKPNPGAPPMPADEIIHRFTQNEDLIQKAFDAKSYDETVRVEELAANGGQFNYMGQVYTKADGLRYQRVVKPPDSNLHYTEFSLQDIKTVSSFPLFFLTSDQLPKYNLSYEGQQKLDEITTFIFRVKPKLLGRVALFDGVIWIDDQDFAIVKSYGQFVTDSGNLAGSFPFQMFETYRENIEGHLWFPTYIRSDGQVKTPKGDIPIRLVVRDTNFKPDEGPAASPAAPNSPKNPGDEGQS
jgi:hypothetical protein